MVLWGEKTPPFTKGDLCAIPDLSQRKRPQIGGREGKEMAYREKISIYLPEEAEQTLLEDAMRFEILKKDGVTVNRNRFLGMLFSGYYDAYARECREKYEAARACLAPYIKGEALLEEAAEAVFQNALLPVSHGKRERPAAKCSFKPTADTEGVLQEIEDGLAPSDSLSGYLCRMLLTYCEKPLPEREQILFQETYEKLQTAAQAKRCVTFSTNRRPDLLHIVLPTGVFVGQDEMYNYLLGMEQDPETGEKKAATFRLNHIQGLRNSAVRMTLTPEVKRDLDRMREHGAQYTIRGDLPAVLALTDKGRKMYLRVYQGRPKPDRIEERDGCHWFYYSCSEDQLFFYFRKFEGGTFFIQEPESLRKRLLAFHAGALADLQRKTEGGAEDGNL